MGVYKFSPTHAKLYIFFAKNNIFLTFYQKFSTLIILS